MFLKDSKAANYLSRIEPGEVVDLQLGDYPAIEALAFAVIEMRQREKDYREFDEEEDMRLAESYAWRMADDSSNDAHRGQIVHSGGFFHR